MLNPTYMYMHSHTCVDIRVYVRIHTYYVYTCIHGSLIDLHGLGVQLLGFM